MKEGVRIQWIGEFVMYLIFVGFLYLIFRMTDGPAYHPHLKMPLWVRILLLLVYVALGATLQTWRHYRKERIRKQRRAGAAAR